MLLLSLPLPQLRWVPGGVALGLADLAQLDCAPSEELMLSLPLDSSSEEEQPVPPAHRFRRKFLFSMVLLERLA